MAEDVINFAVKNGFIWGPEPEIYGGSAGFYSFGPLGKLLKNRVENTLRSAFIETGFWEVECPLIMPTIVWAASGHYPGFVDKVVKCSKCGKAVRIDKLIEEHSKGEVGGTSLSEELALKYLRKNGIKCSSCNSDFNNKIETVNLMMETSLGMGEQAFCRPETATTTYLPFIRYYDFFRKQLPIKVFQIGKAFRNEISPRQNVLRGRQFTQAEAQIFITPELEKSFEEFKDVKKEKLPLWFWQAQKKKQSFKMISLSEALKEKYVKKEAYAWCLWLSYNILIRMGIPEKNIRFRQHFPDEKAFYADDAWDLEILTSTFGWVEVCGVHDRTDYDLKRHSLYSKKDLVLENKETAHILEIAFGPDRLCFAMIDLFVKQEKDRIVYKVPANMAPVQVAVFPLVNKESLPKIAREIWSELLNAGLVAVIDDSGSIGRRYRRMDEKGAPYCVTVDFNTDSKGIVTIRDRDSMKQITVKREELVSSIRNLINGQSFSSAGNLVK